MTARVRRPPAVRLVPLDRDCLAVVRRWVLDAETRELVGTIVPPSDLQHERWYEALQTDPQQLVFVVVAGHPGRPVGVCGLRGIQPVYRQAELWVSIGDRRRRRQGIGAAAVRALLAFAFDTLGLHRVAVRVFGFNTASHAFFRRLGFADEGVERDAVFKRGRFHDVWRMAVLAHGRG